MEIGDAKRAKRTKRGKGRELVREHPNEFARREFSSNTHPRGVCEERI